MIYEIFKTTHKNNNLRRLHKHQQFTVPKMETGKVSVPSSMAAGCICLVCNEYRDDITNYHASTHGYHSSKDMVLDGMVKYLSRAKQDKVTRLLTLQTV